MISKGFRITVTAVLWLVMTAAGSAFAATGAPKIGDPSRMNLSALQANTSYDRFIVVYRAGTRERVDAAAAVQNMAAALGRAGLDRARSGLRGTTLPAVNARFMRKLAIGADLLRTSHKLDRAEAEHLIRQLSTDPTVAYVAPDVMRHAVRDIRAPQSLAQTFTPNDTYYPYYQWHLKAPDGSLTYFGAANDGGANVSNAWDLSDGDGIVIAVLDTGITSHVDVNTSLANAGYDFIYDHFVSGRASDGRVPGGWDIGDWTDEEPWLSACTSASNPPSPSSWHGTHVASTAGAELTNNALGMAGIAYAARVLPVRVLGHCGGYDSDIDDAIVWAAGGHVAGVPDNANPAQVINLSLSGPGACPPGDPQARAIATANALGAVVVVSAGNSDANVADYSPASCPGVVTVAATGITSKRAFYSNYGSSVEIAAPGGGVYTNDDPATGTLAYDGFVWQALNNGSHDPVPNSTTYAGYAGTSQAAPHVSGTVALMQSARLALGLPLLTPAQVLGVLQTTAMAPAVAPDPSKPIGAGIVDAYAAVADAVSDITTLVNAQSPPAFSGDAGSVTMFKIHVPAGARFLSIGTSGGVGDLSMYVRYGAPATAAEHDYSSTHPRVAEHVLIRSPDEGTYYITLVGETAYRNVTIRAQYFQPRR